MLNNSDLPLTDYQRAILTEVGVTFWQFRDSSKPVEEQPQLAEHQINQQTTNTAAKAKVKSPQDALDALKQLKEEVVSLESTDELLLALSEQDIKSKVFADILMAMGLDNKAHKRVSADQLALYKDYPLSWQQGENLSLNENQLTTVSLTEQFAPKAKQQLWQLIQQRLNASQ